MDRMKIVGERLRTARGDRQRSEIAEKAGISLSAIQMYEDGKRMPRDTVKIRLSKVLGVGIADLFYPEFFSE